MRIWVLLLAIVGVVAWSASGGGRQERALSFEGVLSVLRQTGYRHFDALPGDGTPGIVSAVLLKGPPDRANWVAVRVFPTVAAVRRSELVRTVKELYPDTYAHSVIVCNVWIPQLPVMVRDGTPPAERRRIVQLTRREAAQAQREIAAGLEQRCYR